MSSNIQATPLVTMKGGDLMSKGISGLFKKTHGHRLRINSLKSKALSKAQKLVENTAGGRGKAMVVGAFDERTGQTVAAFAGAIPQKIAPELLDRAKTIGGIGSLGLTDRNTVGACAEFHAINQLLLKGSKMSDIHLTNAIRPRTGKPIPYCKNCQSMFNDIINK